MKALSKFFFFLLLATGVNYAFADIQTRQVNGFSAVSVSGSFETYLTQGSSESVKVDAPADIINDIITEVVNGELRVHPKNKNWGSNWFGGNNKKVVVYISAKEVNRVSQSGSGNMFFKSVITSPSLSIHVSGSGSLNGKIETKELQSSVSGSGDMKLEGRAANVNVSVVGSGGYNAGNLATNTVAIKVAGSGDATVNVSDKLDASVMGSGSVHYTGAVKNVSSSKSGSGSVDRL